MKGFLMTTCVRRWTSPQSVWMHITRHFKRIYDARLGLCENDVLSTDGVFVLEVYAEKWRLIRHVFRSFYTPIIFSIFSLLLLFISLLSDQCPLWLRAQDKIIRFTYIWASESGVNKSLRMCKEPSTLLKRLETHDMEGYNKPIGQIYTRRYLCVVSTLTSFTFRARSSLWSSKRRSMPQDYCALVSGSTVV